MEHLRWRVGDVRITRVEEKIHGVKRDTLVPGITDSDLEEHAAWVAPFFSGSGRLLLSVHTFVIEDDGCTIVVDTCSGTEPARPLPGDPEFLDRLGAAIPGGLDAVDVVLCTHLHFDHIGWNTRIVDDERVPTFPRARYLFARVELDALGQDDHGDLRQPSIDPLLEAGLVDLVETDHVITPRVRLIPTPGHTPGHVSVGIASEGQHAVITGDLMHTPLQVALPDLTAKPFDADPELATKTRKHFLDTHADCDRMLLGTHFPPPTSGYVRTVAGGRRFVTEEGP